MILNFFAAKMFVKRVDNILKTWDDLSQAKKLKSNGYSLVSMKERLTKTRNRIVLELNAEQMLFEDTTLARAESTMYEISKEDAEAIVILSTVIDNAK